MRQLYIDPKKNKFKKFRIPRKQKKHLKKIYAYDMRALRLKNLCDRILNATKSINSSNRLSVANLLWLPDQVELVDNGYTTWGPSTERRCSNDYKVIMPIDPYMLFTGLSAE